MKNNRNVLVSIVGPTAVGKTSFGIKLAQHFGSEIISVDSRQFYKEMMIGTAKPSLSERNQVNHHFVDSLSIHDQYTVGNFEREAMEKLKSLFASSKIVLAVGGSGLFFKALWEGFDEMPVIEEGVRERLNIEYQTNGLSALLVELEASDPEYYKIVDRQNWQRVIRALEVIRSTGKPFSSFRVKNKSTERDFENIKIGLELDRGVLFDRINQRMDVMIEEGLFDEASNLYHHRNLNALQTVGYSEIFDFIDDKYDKEDAIRLLKRNSRRYAKRQMTWFKKDIEVNWISPENEDVAIKIIETQLA